MSTKRQVKAKLQEMIDRLDDADEKWVYTEHAEAKHEILRRYLGAWLAILGPWLLGFFK